MNVKKSQQGKIKQKTKYAYGGWNGNLRTALKNQ